MLIPTCSLCARPVSFRSLLHHWSLPGRPVTFCRWEWDASVSYQPVTLLCRECVARSRWNERRAEAFMAVRQNALCELGSVQAGPAAAPSGTDAAARPRPARGRGIRVLCVEDDPIVQKYLEALFQTVADVTLVGLVSSVDEACACLYRQPVDLVLVDNRLPGGHGLDLLEHILGNRRRGDGTDAGPAVLFCTGDDSDALRDRLQARGAMGLVAKSRVYQDLLPAIRSVAQGNPWFPSGSHTSTLAA